MKQSKYIILKYLLGPETAKMRESLN